MASSNNVTKSDPNLESPAFLQRLLNQDQGAFHLLVKHYHPRLLGFAASLTGETLAEEIVQDVFLQLWRSADRFQISRGPLESWLFTMARNRALDFLRLKREKQRRREDSVEDDLPIAAIERPDPEGAIDLSRRTEKVRALMTSLPAAQRRAIELAFFEGLSHSEVATAMGEALGTVKSWIRSGLLQLRESLGEAHS
jgi:RNA polymerase sigma-70 factor (ECF subfamily)